MGDVNKKVVFWEVIALFFTNSYTIPVSSDGRVKDCISVDFVQSGLQLIMLRKVKVRKDNLVGYKLRGKMTGVPSRTSIRNLRNKAFSFHMQIAT